MHDAAHHRISAFSVSLVLESYRCKHTLEIASKTDWPDLRHINVRIRQEIVDCALSNDGIMPDGPLNEIVDKIVFQRATVAFNRVPP